MAAPMMTIFSFPRSLRRSPNAFTAELNRRAVIAGKYIARLSLLLPTFDIRGLPRMEVPDSRWRGTRPAYAAA